MKTIQTVLPQTAFRADSLPNSRRKRQIWWLYQVLHFELTINVCLNFALRHYGRHYARVAHLTAMDEASLYSLQFRLLSRPIPYSLI